MIFSSAQFFIFFILLLLVFIMIKDMKIKKIILLAASIFFYAYWNILFVPLLLGLAVFNYITGIHIDKNPDESKKRRIIMIIGITVNLSVLIFFKYTNFFIENADLILGRFGLNVSILNIILPLGISFFIFELVSYLADIYTCKIKHACNFLDFLIFVFFFPRLASGPIIRAADFLPQLERGIRIKKDNINEGVQIFTMGLFKKLVIADQIAVYADSIFKSPRLFDSVSVWCGVIAYSIQIYCDFSGYSDMAIGIAKIMGFDLPVNFDMPYISLNITEFWRRWHISLSTWLRDYIYIPLGGNRKGYTQKNLNLMITMLLGGLWHGANWTFVLWGGLHGAALIFQKAFTKWHKIKWGCNYTAVTTFFSWLATYIFVDLAWVFFRAGTFHDAFTIITRMFIPSKGVNWIFMPLFIVILPIVIGATVIKCVIKKPGYLIFNLKKPLYSFIFVFVLMSILFLSASKSSPFIYFQF